MGRDFQLAAVEAKTDDEEVWIDFRLPSKDGKTMEEFFSRFPDATQIALYYAAFGQDATASDTMNATVQFLRDVLWEQSYTTIMRRLHDRKDGVTLDVLQQVLEYLFEEVAGRPIQPSSASSPSRTPGGPTSTAKPRPTAQTRSRSPRPASATTSAPG